MAEGYQARKTYSWPSEARALVRNHIESCQKVLASSELQSSVRILVTRIATLTGYPRNVCYRFIRQLGLVEKKAHKEWTRGEQQRLLNLISLNPPHEVAKILGRTPGSIYRMLRRLGASAQMGREWFTVITLAQALHISSSEVQKWIEIGWLRSRTVQTGGLTKRIIDADDFSEFCKNHRAQIIGRRLSPDRLEFVRTFVFPPSHTGILQVRERGYKRKATRDQQEEDNGELECNNDEMGRAEPSVPPTRDIPQIG